MNTMRFNRWESGFTCVAACLLLGACGDNGPEPAKQPADPLLSRALSEVIMIDPDLTGQNQANAAISDGSRDGSLPPINTSEEAVSKARSEAVDLVGGLAEMRELGEPTESKGPIAAPRPLTMTARMVRSGLVTDQCAKKANYTAGWAERMPDAIQIYPHGSVRSAAGVAEDGCRARAVNFRTAVPKAEVLNFYFTKAANAGFKTEFKQYPSESVLSGNKGSEKFVIYGRDTPEGIADFVIVSSAS